MIDTATPLNPRKSFTHWACMGSFFDLFSVAMCIAVMVTALGGQLTPEGTSPIFMQLGFIIVFSLIAASVVLRQSRFVVECTESSVIFKPYRIFGLIPFSRDQKEFARSELGSLILDTKARWSCFTFTNCCCYCCCGFNGLYVTKGLPRDEASVDIAFEIPFFHLTQYSFLYHPCHVRAFEESFHKLAECMNFIDCGVISAHQQKTTPAKEKVIIGTYADHMMEGVNNQMHQMNAWNSDSEANYRNFMAINPLCCTPGTRPKGHGVVRGRAAYFFIEQQEQSVPPPSTAPHAAAPPYPNMPPPMPTTPNFDPNQSDVIRSRNKATVDQLFAALSTNDLQIITQAIPAVYRGDYTSSRMINNQAPVSGTFSGLAALFKYVVVDQQGKYYNCDLLPEQDENPYIMRGSYRIRYPASDWITSFTFRFDERGLVTHGDFIVQQSA